MSHVSEHLAMSKNHVFYNRCEALFARKFGYGRRWKSAAAQALGIGRATLYRYLADDSGVADDVLRRLDELEGSETPVRNDREMVFLIASALVHVQRHIDETGWLPAPYPPSLTRVLDLGAARNLIEGAERWPTDLGSLARLAQEPLFRWVSDMSWDSGDEYFAARLIEDGEVTTECRTLALPGGDPEREIEEHLGYEMLMGTCRDRLDGEELYRAWRRCVIENPVLANWSRTILMDLLLASIERIDEIVANFYDRVPEGLSVNGSLPICSVSGTILRRDGKAFHTECRHPEAIRRARAGEHTPVKYRSGMLYLKRAFRRFWCLPGLAELELERRFQALGWATTLWPGLDRVDLLATSPDESRRVAVDVKDYLSPTRLAVQFAGFKEYEGNHECFLVVPDYVLQVDERFEERFEAVRTANAKAAVELRTVSALVDELEAA